MQGMRTMASDEAEPSGNVRSWLGRQIKNLRIQQGLKLRDVAEKSNLSVSTLSKLENGHLEASFEKLVVIAEALGTDAGRLLSRGDDRAPNGRRSITRCGGAESYVTDHYVYDMLCADLARKKFLPLLTHIKKRNIDDFGAMVKHEGEEFIYVMQGPVELHTEFYAPAVLHAGDSVYFDSTMGHALVAPNGNGLVLWISSTTRYSAEADGGRPRMTRLLDDQPTRPALSEKSIATSTRGQAKLVGERTRERRSQQPAQPRSKPGWPDGPTETNCRRVK